MYPSYNQNDVETEQLNPLIFTKLGYIRQNDMEYKPEWTVLNGGSAIRFVDEYFYNGESVKRSTHIYDSKSGVSGASEAGQVNQGV